MRRLPTSFLECLEAIYRLAPEGSVSLDSLGKRLALSRSPVTERVLGLQGLGLVEPKPSDRSSSPPRDGGSRSAS